MLTPKDALIVTTVVMAILLIKFLPDLVHNLQRRRQQRAYREYRHKQLNK